VRRYQCVLLLGETRLEGGLLAKLSRFVATGGHLVACANQLSEEAGALFGVRIGATEEAYHAIIPEQPQPINEIPFRIHRLSLDADVAVLAKTRQGLPLATRKGHRGGGSTLLLASEFFLSNPLIDRQKIHSEIDQPLPSPYAILEHAKAVLLPYLRSFGLVAVEGSPIQYLVNVTSQTERLVVTLCNNGADGWEGTLRARGPSIRKAVNWMTDRKLAAGRGVSVEVPPLDVVVVELLLDGPAFEVKG